MYFLMDSYHRKVSCGTVYYAVQGASYKCIVTCKFVDEILEP